MNFLSHSGKAAFAVLLLLAAVTFSQCVKSVICIADNGNHIEETINPGPFESVNVSIGGKAYFEHADSYYVIFEGASSHYNALDITVRNGRLKISSEHCFRQSGNIVLRIGAPFVNHVEINGSCKFEALDPIGTTQNFELRINGSGNFTGEVQTAKLRTDINGSGLATFFGSAEEAELKINGSGKYQAFSLHTFSTDVNINGSGHARVWAEDYLNVRISGSGSVHYIGNPQIDSYITGSGKLINAN